MFNAAIKVITGAALCWAGGFICGVAFGQESGGAADADGRTATAVEDADGKTPAAVEDTGGERPTAVEEEIIVRGQSRTALRVQIRRAEEAVYDRFNEINSNDEFDIHCRRQMLTGSNIPRRVCQANFWRDAQRQAGEETVRALQGFPAFDPQQFASEGMYKRQLLDKEIRRLAREDEEFRKDLVRLGTLKMAMQDRTLPRELSETASVEETGDEQALPYDAAVKADVRIGRKPWRHVLRQRTFTIANVYGEIGDVEVDCHGRKEQLQYEAGAEWTVPKDWGACTLQVDAPPSTTFSLYEFDE